MNTSKDELLDAGVSRIIRRSEDRLMNELEQLNKDGHSDEEIVAYLRKQGYTDYAEYYAEHAGVDEREDDNTTLDPVVPDPGDAPSYDALRKAMEGTPPVTFAKARSEVQWP